ncbi:hypothetical protein GCM10023091_40090 [Ravibacter arvi]|uniref:Glycoside hydrolase family 42 N-terminal domain-containing protein n=2 Tax=Ravibacter arvi TaxID=2051041 RepID=A0ABP8M8Z8_9BACT
MKGVPTLLVDGRPYPPFAYMSYLGEKPYYQKIADAGVHLFCIPAYLGDRGINANSGIRPFRNSIWKGYRQYDFSSIETDFKKVVEADPHAMIIVRFYLDAPLWWEESNPGEATLQKDGTTFRQSFYSKKWQDETAGALLDCMDWISRSPYAKNFVGVHVAAGGTEEWFFHRQQQDDHSPLRTAQFRSWIAKKYRNDKNLQHAWKDPDVTLTSCAPSEIGLEKPEKRWRRPGEEQRIVDTFTFQSETLADNIAFFCKVVKKKSRGRLLTGAFYGYHYFLTDPKAGHGALAKLLKCPDLDYISSPNDYHRVAGEDWPPFAAVASVQQHGKLWMAENDTRTHLTTLLKEKAPGIPPPGWYESGVWVGPEKPETSLALLWKNAARMLAYGYGGWWFDMWGGWFDSPELLDVIAKTNLFYTSFRNAADNGQNTEVAVVVDEALSYRDASLGQLTGEMLRNRYSLGKTGAPYDLFLRSDLSSLKSKAYKFIWLLGVDGLSKAETEKIAKWEKSGITVMRTTETGTVFSSGAQKSAQIQWAPGELRSLYQAAGVHIYVSSNEVCYAGNGWVSLHTVSGGERTIYLPVRSDVSDPARSGFTASGVDSITVTLQPNSTLLLRVKPVR